MAFYAVALIGGAIATKKIITVIKMNQVKQAASSVYSTRGKKF